jgi:hypothetical protein
MILKKVLKNFRLYLAFFPLLLPVLSQEVFSQVLPVTNIHWRLIDTKIQVFYDLPFNKDSVDVKILFLKDSDPRFRYVPRFLQGRVGQGIYSGKNNVISWFTEKEPKSIFTGDGFHFRITARKIFHFEKILKYLIYFTH